MVIIVVAFSTAGVLINSALTQWEYNPTITTLDTIAAPIDDIQFPTVTVCNDYVRNVPDKWAILENLLNLINFDCQNVEDLRCNTTNMIRSDYDFFIESAIDILKNWILKEENLG